MNELEEIKKELVALQAKIAKMEQAKNEPTERWKPSKHGEKYKCILSGGEIMEYQFFGDTYYTQDQIESGNIFPKDMPLDNVVMMHQFINEMELICWQLGIKKPASQSYPCQLRTKDEKICYVFDSVAQRDKAYSMLSYKVKDWLKV